MTDKITLTNLSNLENQTTAVNAINANNAVLTTAMDNTLSRDGTSPNTMSASLDMNNNQILNLPAPVSNFDPIRLIDASTLGSGGTITINPLPSGGSTSQVLAKNSSTNFDTSWQTIGSVVTGGTTNQVLTKNSNANFDLKWGNSVTSIGVTAPADFTVTNTPVTTSGNIGVAWATTPTGSGAVVRANSPVINTPTIAQIVNSGNTLTLPAASDTLVGRNTTDTLTNKSIATTQLTGALQATNAPAYAGDVTTSAGSLITAITANAVTNGQQAQMASYTIKGNATNATANPTDISIPALTQKASPISGDMVMIADSAASNALKFATVGSIATAGSVSSLGGATGAITLGSGLNIASNVLQTDPAMIGEVRQVAFNRVPTNFLAANGNSVSRSAYSLLFAALVLTSTVTMTIASPAVVTWTGNAFQNGDPIFFTTSGALPTGVTASTKYYVKGVSGNTFNISTTPGGSAINTSGSQSGTHTGTNAPWEGTAVGNGSTTFTLPNLNGYFVRGIDNNATLETRSFGTSELDAFQGHFHNKTDPGHTHSITAGSNGTAITFFSGGGSNGAGAGANVVGNLFGTGGNSIASATTGLTITSALTDGSNGTPRTAAETRPVNQTLLYVIRYQ